MITIPAIETVEAIGSQLPYVHPLQWIGFIVMSILIGAVCIVVGRGIFQG
jgi:hypothetical protein